MSRRVLQFLRGNGIALIALFLALGGTTWAASLPRNSVGAKQIKKNAVTNPKIKNNAVTGAKVKDNSLTGKDIVEGTLGKVPAAHDADLVGGLAPSAFVQKTETLTGHWSCAGTAWENQRSNQAYTVLGSLKAASGAASILVRCSVNVPDGATITAVNFTVRDNSATDNMDCQMWRTNMAASVGTETLMASVATDAAGTPGDVRISDTTINQPVIDNDNFAYFVQCNTGTTSTTGVYGANLTYSVSGAGGAASLKPKVKSSGSGGSSSAR